MAQGRLRKAVDNSIRSAVESGSLDLEKHAAPIAMLRYMADSLDSDRGKTTMLKLVTPASFLSYCDALGLTPGSDLEKQADKPKPTAKLVAFTSSAKFAKAVND